MTGEGGITKGKLNLNPIHTLSAVSLPHYVVVQRYNGTFHRSKCDLLTAIGAASDAIGLIFLEASLRGPGEMRQRSGAGPEAAMEGVAATSAQLKLLGKLVDESESLCWTIIHKAAGEESSISEASEASSSMAIHHRAAISEDGNTGEPRLQFISILFSLLQAMNESCLRAHPQSPQHVMSPPHPFHDAEQWWMTPAIGLPRDLGRSSRKVRRCDGGWPQGRRIHLWLWGEEREEAGKEGPTPKSAESDTAVTAVRAMAASVAQAVATVVILGVQAASSQSWRHLS